MSVGLYVRRETYVTLDLCATEEEGLLRILLDGTCGIDVTRGVARALSVALGQDASVSLSWRDEKTLDGISVRVSRRSDYNDTRELAVDVEHEHEYRLLLDRYDSRTLLEGLLAFTGDEGTEFPGRYHDGGREQ